MISKAQIHRSGHNTYGGLDIWSARFKLQDATKYFERTPIKT